MEKKIGGGLRGNALGNSPEEQLELVREGQQKFIVGMVRDGYEVS